MLTFRPALSLFFSFFLLSPIVHSADLEAGKILSETCQGCHGKNGNSTNPQTPNLAGQRAIYLEYQLKAFQSGKRSNPLMQAMAKNLDRQEMKNIAAYFASLSLENTTQSTPSIKGAETKIARCTGCHGKSAIGKSGFPRLAGQRSDYLKKQLLNFKNKTRKGGPMNSIASSLSEQDIEEISIYLGNLSL